MYQKASTQQVYYNDMVVQLAITWKLFQFIMVGDMLHCWMLAIYGMYLLVMIFLAILAEPSGRDYPWERGQLMINDTHVLLWPLQLKHAQTNGVYLVLCELIVACFWTTTTLLQLYTNKFFLVIKTYNHYFSNLLLLPQSHWARLPCHQLRLILHHHCDPQAVSWVLLHCWWIHKNVRSLLRRQIPVRTGPCGAANLAVFSLIHGLRGWKLHKRVLNSHLECMGSHS